MNAESRKRAVGDEDQKVSRAAVFTGIVFTSVLCASFFVFATPMIKLAAKILGPNTSNYPREFFTGIQWSYWLAHLVALAAFVVHSQWRVKRNKRPDCSG